MKQSATASSEQGVFYRAEDCAGLLRRVGIDLIDLTVVLCNLFGALLILPEVHPRAK
jgi:hypothetical protein